MIDKEANLDQQVKMISQHIKTFERLYLLKEMITKLVVC